MYILIGILVLFILSIVAAYYGSQVWHWAHVLLVVAIFLASAGFLILASKTLRTIAHYRSEAHKIEEQLARVNADVDALRQGTRKTEIINGLTADEVKIPEGTEVLPSIGDLDHQLHLLTRIRGRVWRNVAPVNFDPKTDTVRAGVETPQPAGIDRDSILFLFEQGEPALPDPTRGAQFLGEFRVTGVEGQQVTMESVQQLDDFEKQRLAGSHGPWALHETMPVDRYELFAGFSEEQLRKVLPEKSVQEYIRQGSPKGPDDEEWQIAYYDEDGNQIGPDDVAKLKQEGKAIKEVFHRRLRDYALEFDELAKRRVVLLADMAAVVTDNERLKTALASAKQLQAFREEELRKLTIDLAGVKKERGIIEQHLAAVQAQLTNAQQLLKDSLAENARLAGRAQQQGLPMDNRSSAVPAEGPLAVSAP